MPALFILPADASEPSDCCRYRTCSSSVRRKHIPPPHLHADRQYSLAYPFFRHGEVAHKLVVDDYPPGVAFAVFACSASDGFLDGFQVL